MIVVSGAILLVGLAWLARTVRAPYANYRFQQSARSADGEVLRITSYVVKRQTGWTDEVVAYRPFVRFTLPDGRIVETEATQMVDDPLPQGAPVSVRYDSRDPTVARIAGGARARFETNVETLVGASAVVVIGLFFLLTALAS